MVKDTFLRIKDEKKSMILENAIVLFGDKLLRDVTVSDVLKATNLPRGSFYQYFDNVRDLYFEVLYFIFKPPIFKKDNIINTDIFTFAYGLFNHIYEQSLKKERSKFFKVLYEQMDNDIKEYICHLKMDSIKKLDSNTKEVAGIKVLDECTLKILNSMVLNAVHSTILEMERNNCSQEKGRILLEKKFNLIKYGVMEEKKRG